MTEERLQRTDPCRFEAVSNSSIPNLIHPGKSFISRRSIVTESKYLTNCGSLINAILIILPAWYYSIMFTSATYTDRRSQLGSKIKSGIVLLLGNEESSINFADNTYPFRQDSSFLYFFGLNQPGLAGIIDIDEGRSILFGEDLTIDHIVWMGYHPTLAERAATAGVSKTGNTAELEDYLKKALASGRRIHFLPPYRPENSIRISDLLNMKRTELGNKVSTELIRAVVAMREIKTPEEISEIEKAVNTSVDMHVAAMKMAVPGVRESQIAARVQEIATSTGGQMSFPAIATVHGETLHNHYHGNILQEGDLFLLDAGAETKMGYAGDLSSTVPVSSGFTSRQKEVYDISLKAHETAVSHLSPGVPFKEIYYKSAAVIVDGMKKLGLMKGDTQSALELGVHAMFFPCGLGHQMGLDVHDMEDLGEVYVGWDGVEKSTQFGLKSLRLGKVLKPGMVLTIEPGIYFIPALIDLWKGDNKFRDYLNYEKLETYKDFGGIRNEENFLITDKGFELLGKKKPKSFEEIRAVRE